MNALPSQDIKNAAGSTPGSYILFLKKCDMVKGKLIPRGQSIAVGIKDAMARLAPSMSPRSRANVLRVRRGQYIGTMASGNNVSNFVIINPTRDGDIRWLLRKNPELEFSLKEVFMVEEVTIPRDFSDLPSMGGSD